MIPPDYGEIIPYLGLVPHCYEDSSSFLGIGRVKHIEDEIGVAAKRSLCIENYR